MRVRGLRNERGTMYVPNVAGVLPGERPITYLAYSRPAECWARFVAGVVTDVGSLDSLRASYPNDVAFFTETTPRDSSNHQRVGSALLIGFFVNE